MQDINEFCGPPVCWSWPTLVYIWIKLWAHFSVWAKLHHSVILSRPSLHTTQSSIWQVPWALPAAVKMLQSRSYHSPPFSVKVLAAMKSYLHSHTHFLGIVLAYTQMEIYIFIQWEIQQTSAYRNTWFILIKNNIPSYLLRSSSGRWYWRMYYVECQKPEGDHVGVTNEGDHVGVTNEGDHVGATNEGDHVGVTNEGDCCRVVWNDNYSTPTITIFIDRDLVYSELRSWAWLSSQDR